MTPLTVNRCRGCDRPILWARTEAGRKIPLDPEPSREGNMTLDGSTAIYVPPEDRLETPLLMMPHHATCPEGKRWRRPRGQRSSA